MKEYIVTVMASDRTGIVAAVSSALAEIGGNITHLNQTVVRGYYTHIISAEMPDELNESDIRSAVESSGKSGEFEVNVRLYETPSADMCINCEPYTLTMQGNDRKGIIAAASSHLAKANINIEDFFCIVHEGRLLMLAKVSLPQGTDIARLQGELEQLGADFGLSVHFQHENIFRATSEVLPVADFI